MMMFILGRYLILNPNSYSVGWLGQEALNVQNYLCAMSLNGWHTGLN